MRRLAFVLLALLSFPSNARAWEWGDTLTTIWKPLPNLPQIARPGDTVQVWANAPSGATGWQATLLFGDLEIALPPAGGGWQATKARWELGFIVPPGTPEEIYDFVLDADAMPPDTSRHSVKVIPAYRSEFYFAQISDTHFPSHPFSTPGTGFSTADTSAFPDFNAVAADLNLIHPEFVLHTGDLVNEGELEEWLAMFEMSRAKAALSRLRSPVFVVSGNHDIGGWDATTPPDGTARRNWWKLFGWPYLDAPPAGDPVHSQNYGFDYGSLHVVGLETWINNGPYDSFRTNLYGAQSFSPEQMNWLTAHLASLPPGTRKLLFYHYDFGGTLGNGSPGPNFSQINPVALGVDGVVWGHNHGVAEGNLAAKPFNLGLKSVIDGVRAFRIFRYANGVITPGPMHRAGTTLDSLSQSWNRNNNGTADDITTTIINRYGESWPYARQVFHMKPGWPEYVATNGTIVQEIEHDGMHDVYVEFNLPASGTVQLRVEGTYPLDVKAADLPAFLRLSAAPNPLVRGGAATLSFSLPQACEVDLGVYDVAGRRVVTLASGVMPVGPHTVRWDAARAAGVYLVRLDALGARRTAKLVVLP